MGDEEWRDGDDPKLRKLLGYALRDHVAYQDGRDSEAPALLFADYDYEVGDGTCGVSEDGKRCNEPAIVYARADALMDAIDRAEKAERQRDYNSEVIEQRNVMLTRAEAERDAAWNDAIEAAANVSALWLGINSEGEPDGTYCGVEPHDSTGMLVYIRRDLILALRK